MIQDNFGFECEHYKKILGLINESFDNEEAKIKKVEEIIKRYIIATNEIVAQDFLNAFYEFKRLLIIEMVLNKDLSHFVENNDYSTAFRKKYYKVKNRINEEIDVLMRKSITEYEIDNFLEVVVIIFRVLKYLDLKDNKLYLKDHSVRIYNDIRSNIFILEFEENGIRSYKLYKSTISTIENLKQEIEYINAFVMNYLDQKFKNYFRISKIYYDDSNVRKNFIEGEVSFKSSVKIIEKLVGPLYLNKEKYGIRELLQNAVDACIRKKREVSVGNYSPKVKLIYKRGEKPTIEISDNGIGMDEYAIIHHFLTVGESSKNPKESNEGYIGKFGIGILSSFLLTDELAFETTSKPSGNNIQYTYISEAIHIEKLRGENSLIHIEKRKENGNKDTGTIILLLLKNEIIKNIGETLAKKIKTIMDQYNFAFNKKNQWSKFDRYKNKLWKNYTTEVDKLEALYSILALEKAFPDIFAFPEFLDHQGNIIVELLETISVIQKVVVIDNRDEPDEPDVKKKLIEALDNFRSSINELKWLDALACFEYLDANRWYLSDEVTIDFYCDSCKLEFYKNTYFNNFTEIQSGEDRLNIKYLWVDDFDLKGKIICNNIQIPTKYEFKNPQAKMFKQFPLFSLVEKGNERLDIDLSRERCDISKYEDVILCSLIINTINEIMEGEQGQLICESEKIHNIPVIYYKRNGRIYSCVKSIFTIKELYKNGFRKYKIVTLPYGAKNEIDDFIDYLENDCIYEFSYLRMNTQTTWQDIESNHFKVCAEHNIDVYIYTNEKLNYLNFRATTNFSKALFLAAHNIGGDIVDVTIANQLQLNNNFLKQFKDDATFDKLIEEKKDSLQIDNVIYLNYRRNDESNSEEFKRTANILNKMNYEMTKAHMIIALDLQTVEGINRVFRAFESISSGVDSIYNDFQSAIQENSIKNRELYEVLMEVREYTRIKSSEVAHERTTEF